MIRSLSLTIFILGFSAQAATPANLTLTQALKKGFDFSLEVKKAESAKKAAEDDFRLAESKIFPEIDLKGSGGTTKNSATFKGSFNSSSVGSTTESYTAELGVTQPLYTGGALIAGLSSAKVKMQTAEQDLFTAKQSYAFSVIDAYMQAARDQILYNLAQENRTILKGYAKITTQYAAIGRSKDIDKLSADASYNLSEAEVLDTENTSETSMQQLLRLTGIPQGTTITLDTQLPLEPVKTGSLHDLYQKAMENNPDVKSLELQVESLKYDNEVTESVNNPTLALTGYWGYESADRPTWFQDNSQTYNVALNLTIPLFSGLSSIDQKRKDTELVYQKQKDLAIKQKDLEKSLATALATLNKAFERLKLTQKSAESARKAMKAALHDYREGLVSSTDVLNIQNTRYNAEKEYASAQYSYNQQVLSLRQDLGIDLEKTYDAKYK